MIGDGLLLETVRVPLEPAIRHAYAKADLALALEDTRYPLEDLDDVLEMRQRVGAAFERRIPVRAMSDELEPWDGHCELVTDWADRALERNALPTFAPVLIEGELALASGAVCLESDDLDGVARSPNHRVRAFGAIYAVGRLYDVVCETLGATPATLPSGDDV